MIVDGVILVMLMFLYVLGVMDCVDCGILVLIEKLLVVVVVDVCVLVKIVVDKNVFIFVGYYRWYNLII